MENLPLFLFNFKFQYKFGFGVSKDIADLVYIQTFVMSIHTTYIHSTNMSLNTYHVPNARRNLRKSKACLH